MELKCEKKTNSKAIYLIKKNNAVHELDDASTTPVQAGDIVVIGWADVLSIGALADLLLPVNADEQVRAWSLKGNLPNCSIVLVH